MWRGISGLEEAGQEKGVDRVREGLAQLGWDDDLRLKVAQVTRVKNKGKVNDPTLTERRG